MIMIWLQENIINIKILIRKIIINKSKDLKEYSGLKAPSHSELRYSGRFSLAKTTSIVCKRKLELIGFLTTAANPALKYTSL